VNRFTIEVNESLCTSCDTCAQECSTGKTRSTLGTGDCTGCLHCYTVCPANAITVKRNGSAQEVSSRASPIGLEVLKAFFASRMSTRRFLPEEPSAAMLDRLVDAARHTPSGGNRHAHELTFLPRGPTRDLLLAQLKRTYTKRSLLLNSPVLRTVLWPFVGSYARSFIADREYAGRVAAVLAKLRRGKDPIFYGAPTVIFFHSRVLVPTPKEDCVIAAYAVALSAHASGLGACFVTLAQSAVNASRTCKELLGLSRKDKVHAVLLVGHPAVRFLKAAPRPPLRVRTVGGIECSAGAGERPEQSVHVGMEGRIAPFPGFEAGPEKIRGSRTLIDDRLKESS
jgi:nitroreductase/NAD-dependent dihydropyrimidine dehydrogenase PreA subunit